MKKKIFFTDLDETLLTREKNMTPATVDVITKLTEKDIMWPSLPAAPLTV